MDLKNDNFKGVGGGKQQDSGVSLEIENWMQFGYLNSEHKISPN